MLTHELEPVVEATAVAPVEEKPEIDVAQQMETTIKMLKVQQKALSDLVVLDVRNLLRMLSDSRTAAIEKKQIRESIERAIIMAFDYGVDIVKPTLREHGALGKLECSFAAHMARLKENGMVLIADRMSKEDQNSYEKGAHIENTQNIDANSQDESQSQIDEKSNEAV